MKQVRKYVHSCVAEGLSFINICIIRQGSHA